MKKSLSLETIHLFFRTLAKEWPYAAEILLVGGAAALAMGGRRPTLDIDFEVSLDLKQINWNDFERAINHTKEKVGIGIQFSECVERWSQISFLDYTKHRRLFKRYGKINVALLEAPYWSIGKISRYWDQDIKDMIAVFSKEKPNPLALARLWHKALENSPVSTRLFGVKKQMFHFFKIHGLKIWGKQLPFEEILSYFYHLDM